MKESTLTLYGILYLGTLNVLINLKGVKRIITCSELES